MRENNNPFSRDKAINRSRSRDDSCWNYQVGALINLLKNLVENVGRAHEQMRNVREM